MIKMMFSALAVLVFSFASAQEEVKQPLKQNLEQKVESI
jgi:hypothetical protein